MATIKHYHDSGGIHGYDIGKTLYELTNGAISGTNARYYAILRRLEQDKLLLSKVKSDTGRIRKYYFLTDLGEKVLNNLFTYWQYYSEQIQELFQKIKWELK